MKVVMGDHMIAEIASELPSRGDWIVEGSVPTMRAVRVQTGEAIVEITRSVSPMGQPAVLAATDLRGDG
jgi:hypothetical protein